MYKATFQQVIQENEKYYEEYDTDVGLVRDIVAKLEENLQTFITLEDSKEIKHTVTGRTFLTVGRSLGAIEGHKKIHDLVELMSAELNKAGGKLSDDTFNKYLECLSFNLHKRPLYGVMHESIYCYGPKAPKSDWAAKRVALGEYRDKFWWVDEKMDMREGLKTHPEKLYFSGEMIYPFMLRCSGAAVSRFDKVANELAEKDNWPQLYDLDQLRKNTVQGRAIAYLTDMYVARSLSDETADKVAGLAMVDSKITKGWSHKTIKVADTAANVFKALFPLPGEE